MNDFLGFLATVHLFIDADFSIGISGFTNCLFTYLALINSSLRELQRPYRLDIANKVSYGPTYTVEYCRQRTMWRSCGCNRKKIIILILLLIIIKLIIIINNY